MALAWKAGWVQALRGSNPLSSATLTSTNAGTGLHDSDRRSVLSLSSSPDWGSRRRRFLLGPTTAAHLPVAPRTAAGHLQALGLTAARPKRRGGGAVRGARPAAYPL